MAAHGMNGKEKQPSESKEKRIGADGSEWNQDRRKGKQKGSKEEQMEANGSKRKQGEENGSKWRQTV